MYYQNLMKKSFFLTKTCFYENFHTGKIFFLHRKLVAMYEKIFFSLKLVFMRNFTYFFHTENLLLCMRKSFSHQKKIFFTLFNKSFFSSFLSKKKQNFFLFFFEKSRFLFPQKKTIILYNIIII